MTSVINQGERATRKPHRCAYCDDPISVGARAAWWAWADAGRAGTSYGHPECVAADHWYAAETGTRDDDELMDPGDFYREVLPAYREHARVKTAAGGTSTVRGVCTRCGSGVIEATGEHIRADGCTRESR